MVRHHRFEVWTRFAWGCTYEKPACQSFATWSVPAIVKCPMGREVCTYENTACESVLAASVLFLSLFPAGWCLLMLLEALAQTSMLEKEWQIHVSQADCHSATTASVVWLLALDFIFTLCVSPCPGILILDDVVQTRSFLDWSHTDAFDFSRLCLYQHWSWGQGGARWI